MRCGVAAAVGPAWLPPWSSSSQWPRWPAQGSTASSGGNGKSGNLKSYVPDTLLSAIQQNPKQSFDVILQGDTKQKAHGFIQKILGGQERLQR